MSNRTGPMVCPVDQTTLVMSERQGIEIDYCPTCRGVWLDRGELDKIIERNLAPGGGQASMMPPAPPQGGPPPGGHWQPQTRPIHHHSDDYHHSGYGGRRRKSWLEELFD
jgi:Zn-finger nucleic acid-binding protein